MLCNSATYEFNRDENGKAIDKNFSGNCTDVALLKFVDEWDGLNDVVEAKYSPIDEIAFSSARKWMMRVFKTSDEMFMTDDEEEEEDVNIVVEQNENNENKNEDDENNGGSKYNKSMISERTTNSRKDVMILKGAPDILLDKLGYILEPNGKSRAISQSDAQKLLELNNEWCMLGQRVLLVCKKVCNYEKLKSEQNGDMETYIKEMNGEFCLIGLVGIVDSPRYVILKRNLKKFLTVFNLLYFDTTERAWLALLQRSERQACVCV